MFTGARDFNVGRLGIISAGRDVNINVISTAGSPARTLDLQALFAGVLDSTGAPGQPHGDSTLDVPGDGDVVLAETGKAHRRGFKRALYGALRKLKGKTSKSSDESGQVESLRFINDTVL